MEHELVRINKVLPEILKKTSPTFCLAKWHHVTMYLHLGETHSCYHPPPHEIPLDELKDNPSALHNTKQKKLERKQMLDGEKPSGCQYCWNVESLGDDYISDRKQRTVSIYQSDPKRIDEIKSHRWDYNVNPEYIEVSFGNACNFKCGYCHPRYSSKFLDEIRTNGEYQNMNTGKYDIDWFVKKLQEDEEQNPYVKAWFDWWPTMSKTLNILRITGGEPLIHGSTYRMLDLLNEKPLPHLELNINTNLGVGHHLVDRFVNKLKPIIEKEKVKDFKLFTSIDIWGEDAEYLRTGLDLQLFEKNLHKYLTGIENSRMSLMITFNILCVVNFRSLLEKILEWRKKYNNPELFEKEYEGNMVQRIQFDTPYLKEPPHYDMNILTSDFLPYMESHLLFMEENKTDESVGGGYGNGFDQLEIAKFKRVVDYMRTKVENPDEEYVKKGRADFYSFFTQYDKRRDQDFYATFPEYHEFMELCKNEYKEQQKNKRPPRELNPNLGPDRIKMKRNIEELRAKIRKKRKSG
tara:strand:- start:1011 stop:2570 length:1560 start_codon:yes stop_codon:yes gene_type:complete